jgi:hypothetical protein
MTIAGLLRKHGHDVPRWVSASGALLIGTSASTGMPVAPHKFHGGEALTDEPLIGGRAWWTDDAALQRDREDMRRWFPAFTELDSNQEAAPAWFGRLDTGSGQFSVGVIHRLSHELPRVVHLGNRHLGKSIGGRWMKPPHTYLDGSLCVAAQEDWDPSRDTIATVVGWTAHWAACYNEWLLNGFWPVDGFVPRVAA